MSRGLHSSITVLLEIVTENENLDELNVLLAFVPKVNRNTIMAILF